MTPKLNYDELLKKQTLELFKLDDISDRIIAFITKEGQKTKYDLEKKITKVTKPTIYSRVEDLVKGDYLSVVAAETFGPTGLEKKYYGLTFKGFLASLRNIKLYQNYLFKNLLDHVSQTSISNSEVLLNFEEFLKADLAFWFQYHLENGLVLSNLKQTAAYYLGTHNSNYIAPDELPGRPIYEKRDGDKIYVDFEKVYTNQLNELWQRKKGLSEYLLSGEMPVTDKEEELLAKLMKNWPIYMFQYYKAKLWRESPEYDHFQRVLRSKVLKKHNQDSI